MSDSNSRLVYSTDTGRIKEEPAPVTRAKGDGIVRVQRQTSGCKGKSVCIITGLDLDDDALTALAAELKKNVAVAVRSRKAPLRSRAISAIC